MWSHLFVALIFSRRLMLDTFTNTCRNELFARLPLNFNCLHSEELWISLTRVTFVIDSAVCDFNWNLTQISCKTLTFVKNLMNLSLFVLSRKEDLIFKKKKCSRWYYIYFMYNSKVNINFWWFWYCNTTIILNFKKKVLQ